MEGAEWGRREQMRARAHTALFSFSRPFPKCPQWLWPGSRTTARSQGLNLNLVHGLKEPNYLSCQILQLSCQILHKKAGVGNRTGD